MSSTVTQTTIASGALQLLGYQPISSLQENSRGARAMNRAYQSVLLGELQSNFWRFSIRRAQLAASATKPAFGKQNYFPLPPDFLELAPPDQNLSANFGFAVAVPNVPSQVTIYDDFEIENAPGIGPAIASNQPGPIYIKFVSSDITEAQMDAMFVVAFQAALAVEACEELTNSNTKLAALTKMYDDAIETAKKRNAFQSKPVRPPVDSWILARL